MRLNLTRDHYIRPGSQKIAAKNSSAVVYIYELAGKPYALGFRGKAIKPAFHIAFRDAQSRETYVLKYFADVDAAEHYHAKRKAEQKARNAEGHDWNVGTILYGSWGYDQTNVDFFEVVKVVGKQTVEIEQIGSIACKREDYGYSDMSGHVIADTTQRTGKVTRHKVSDRSIKSPIYGYARRWDGRPIYSSWYA